MTLKTIISILREARKITEANRLAKIDSDERAAIAKAFNDRYTYRFQYYPKPIKYTGKHAWMCPECSCIHISCGFDAFTGMQFPPCCATLAGHRLHENIRSQ